MKNIRLLLFLFFVIASAVLSAACAENDDAADAEAPAAEPTAEVAAAEPTAAASSAGAAVQPTEAPSELPTVPPAAPTATAVPVVEEPAAQRFGILRIRDNDNTPSGSFQLLMEGISPAPDGTHYVLWLLDDRFNTLNLGTFAVADGTVQYAGDTEQNLLSAYSSAFISLEPDGVTDGEIGPIAFNGVVPAGALLHVNHIVTTFAGNPEGNAFLIGAQGQLHHAMEHTGFLMEELTNDNLREAQRHAEHVVNILDGETGANFGDLDGDTVAQNPGDGVGVRGYLEGAKQHAQLAVDA
ncbi:MAG: anti-sigma factor, partial [Anaerolineales bacterium]|nr:anti-sigma factor [Anaerolineales bacterium]